LSNLCEPVPFFCDHIALIDRDNFYHQSLRNLYAVFVDEVDLQKKLILTIAFTSKLFSKTQIVPAEIIVVECTDTFWSEDTLKVVMKDSLLYKGAKFQITNYGYHWQYRVDGITPSTQTTVVTEDTNFVVRKIDTLETTQMHPPY
jgi:hypothetical protein